MPSSGLYKFKKHELSSIEHNAYQQKKMIKIILFDVWDPTIFSLKVGFLNLFSNPP
jgi:hypothetical protein